ncbi:hypothetical protein MBLNU457_6403t1 [Dothideomycetes sp. NU457]
MPSKGPEKKIAPKPPAGAAKNAATPDKKADTPSKDAKVDKKPASDAKKPAGGSKKNQHVRLDTVFTIYRPSIKLECLGLNDCE